VVGLIFGGRRIATLGSPLLAQVVPGRAGCSGSGSGGGEEHEQAGKGTWSDAVGVLDFIQHKAHSEGMALAYKFTALVLRAILEKNGREQKE